MPARHKLIKHGSGQVTCSGRVTCLEARHQFQNLVTGPAHLPV